MDDTAVQLTDNISEADALLALQSRLKKNPGIQAAAKSHETPIYVTKTSSLVQIRKAIRALMSDHDNVLKDFGTADKMRSSEKIDALEEARIAVEQIVIPKGESVELLPRPPHIISIQLDLIQKYQLEAERIRSEAGERLCVLPFHSAGMTKDGNTSQPVGGDGGFDDLLDADGNTNGSPYSVERLPLLPE